MANRARSLDGPDHGQVDLPAAASVFRPLLAQGGEPSLASPVHDLQRALEAEFAPPQIKKWHPLARVGFITAFCGSFWGLVALAVIAAT